MLKLKELDTSMITNPSQEGLDDLLIELVKMSEEYASYKKQISETQYVLDKEIDKICNLVDDKGKKLHTYKNQAESVVRNEQRDVKDSIERLTDIANMFKIYIENYTKVYYHARAKLSQDNTLDMETGRVHHDLFFT